MAVVGPLLLVHQAPGPLPGRGLEPGVDFGPDPLDVVALQVAGGAVLFAVGSGEFSRARIRRMVLTHLSSRAAMYWKLQV